MHEIESLHTIEKPDGLNNNRYYLPSGYIKPVCLELLRRGRSTRYNDEVDGNRVSPNRPRRGETLLIFRSVAYPAYVSFKKRLESFSKWNSEHVLKPDLLAELGFFYAGYADCTRCYMCGLGIKYWREFDEPNYHHARLRPQCEYIRALKGEEFIAEVEAEESRKANANTNQDVEADSGFSEGAINVELDGGNSEEAANVGLRQKQHGVLADASKGFDQDQADSGIGLSPGLSLDVSDSLLTGASNDWTRDTSDYLQISSSDGLAKGSSDGLAIGSSDGLAIALDSVRVNLLEKEHKILKERLKCFECKTRDVSCLYLPCGHVIACDDCADVIANCSICKRTVFGTAQIHF